MIKVIALDWNGTLTSDLFEIHFFNGLLKKVARKELFNPFLYFKILRLQALAKAISTTQQFNQNKINSVLPLLISQFNSIVRGRIKMEDLHYYVLEFINKSMNLINGRLVKAIEHIRSKHEIIVCIVSSGYFLNITKTLEQIGFYIDFVKANDFEVSPSGHLYYDLKILNNKDVILEKMIKEMGLRLKDVAYIGDDWNDVNCFRKVGHPILAPFISCGLDENLKHDCKLFCPRNESEFVNYLEENISKRE